MAFFVIILLSFVVPALLGSLVESGVMSSNAILPTILSPLVLFLIFDILFSYIWAQLSWKYYKYEVAANGFKKESGVIGKRYVTIPYDRIQNVDIYRSLLARMLGLSDLHIQTAGMSYVGKGGVTSEGRLPGVSFEVAEKLRDELINRATHARGKVV